MRISPLSPLCRIVTFVPSSRRELVLKRRRVGVDGRGPSSRARRLAGILAEALDVPDRQALGDDAVGERVRIGDGEQRAGVAGRNLPAREQSARVCSGRLVSRNGVGDVAPALADDARDVAVRIAVNLAELGVAGGLLERVEVGPLHVFDDGDLERLAVAGLDDDDRDLVQPRPLRGPPAALAGDDLVSVRDAGNGANDDRLDDPALLDRGGEFVELRIVEPLSRIARIGAQELDRRLARAARDLGMRRVRPAQQGRESAPKARPIFGAGGCVFGHGSFPWGLKPG